jgi:hypothetical protein
VVEKGRKETESRSCIWLGACVGQRREEWEGRGKMEWRGFEVEVEVEIESESERWSWEDAV